MILLIELCRDLGGAKTKAITDETNKPGTDDDILEGKYGLNAIMPLLFSGTPF